MDNKIIASIESGKLVEVQELLGAAITEKVNFILEEKKKEVVAKTWNTQTLKEADEKSLFKAAKRKSFQAKMKSLKKVK
jgi:hypothetical protein